MASTDPQKECLTQNAAFHTTRWSVVLDAQGAASDDSMRSLEALCRQYWPPLYAYARYRGMAPHDAEDLTQEFFARLLEKEWLAAVKRERGRFRTFLLMASHTPVQQGAAADRPAGDTVIPVIFQLPAEAELSVD